MSSTKLNGANGNSEHLLNGHEKNQDIDFKNVTKNSNEPIELDIESTKEDVLTYRVNDIPPIHLQLAFAIQHILLVFASPLSLTLIVAEVVCAQDDEVLKVQILSAFMFLVGISTFCMSTFGLRLPVFQGPAKTYLIPLLAMKSFEEWKCPATFTAFDPLTNASIPMVIMANSTTMTARDFAIGKISELSGSMVIAGVVHFLIGTTGLVGVFCRFIGPITIVPTIVLVGLTISDVVVKFVEPSLLIGCVVVFCNIVFALILGNRLTPIPWWNRKRGFYIHWSQIHRQFPILISMVIGWLFSGLLTHVGFFSNDPSEKDFLARTDARSFLLEQSDWFIFPYPGKLGGFKFNIGVFINFTIATLLSVLDSIGDYAATAKTARVPPPPNFAFNRGIAVEGLMTCLAGALGCCAATVSYGGNIGAMRLTKVVSRRVFQVIGFIFVLFAVNGKISAFAMTIPYPVLGGTTLVTIGIFLGLVLSYLETVDLSSTRNLAILGMSLLLGTVLPKWIARNQDYFDTGNTTLDMVLMMLFSNPSFIGGGFACLLDNIVPGTLKGRGLLTQLKDLDDTEASEMAKTFEDGPEVYRIPFIPQGMRRSKIFKYIPLFYREE